MSRTTQQMAVGTPHPLLTADRRKDCELCTCGWRHAGRRQRALCCTAELLPLLSCRTDPSHSASCTDCSQLVAGDASAAPLCNTREPPAPRGCAPLHTSHVKQYTAALLCHLIMNACLRKVLLPCAAVGRHAMQQRAARTCHSFPHLMKTGCLCAAAHNSALHLIQQSRRHRAGLCPTHEHSMMWRPTQRTLTAA